MKFPKYLLTVIALGSLSGPARPANAQAAAAAPSESSWTALTDDYSRQMLFDTDIVAAKLKDEATQPNSSAPTDLAIPKDFVFPDDARFDKILKKDRVDSLFGVDISHYTGSKIKFDNLRLQRVLFVYAKATQGIGSKDALFGGYWSSLATYAALPPDQRLYRGAYHFLTAADPGTDQAGRFVDYVELHGGFKADDMPPCLDLEWDRTATNPDRWKGTSPDAILQKAMDWLKEVERRTHRKPMIYTAAAFWKDRGIPLEKIALFKDYPIWVADYSTSHKASEKPSTIADRKQDMWQFAEDAKLSTGYPGGLLDANIYYGTFDQFKKDFGLPQ